MPPLPPPRKQQSAYGFAEYISDLLEKERDVVWQLLNSYLLECGLEQEEISRASATLHLESLQAAMQDCRVND